MENNTKAADEIGITFVNSVVGRGIMNGVINVSFSVFNFTPDDNNKVDLDPVIACRLRMDKVCAMQLRDAMNDLLSAIEKVEADAAPPAIKETVNEGILPKVRAEKMN